MIQRASYRESGSKYSNFTYITVLTGKKRLHAKEYFKRKIVALIKKVNVQNNYKIDQKNKCSYHAQFEVFWIFNFSRRLFHKFMERRFGYVV